MARLVTILGFVCAFSAAMHAATFTVTTTADSGAGSLRQAILDANANGNVVTDTIAFAIPGAGVQTIAPATELPDITTPVLIDGYTQAGSSVNTLTFANGTNAVILIDLDGVTSTLDGLSVLGSGSTVRGLTLQRFNTGIYVAAANVAITGNSILGNGYGIYIENSNANQIGNVAPAFRNVISGNNIGIGLGGADSNTISGNYIGTAADGSTALGNNTGIEVQAAQDNVIFDNLISGNSTNPDSAAIELTGSSTGNIIAGNLIGTTASGVGSVPNRFGIDFTTFVMGHPTNNTIGTLTEPNTFANNLLDAIRMDTPFSAGNRIEYNNFRDNGGLAIDLLDDGPTANDNLDADAGPNLMQNHPVIMSATRSAGGAAIVSGTLHSAPSTTFKVQLHFAIACDPSGFGEGLYVAESNVSTDAAGNGSFTASMPFLPNGNVTATAIDPDGNTSEFSACVAIVSEDPQLTIVDESVVEGNAGTSLITFTVTLTPASLFTVTVNAQTANDSATAGSDYVAAAQPLTFAPGETTKTFSVTINGDPAIEPDETFFVQLSGATNASIADDSATGTITNDDSAVAPAVPIPALDWIGLAVVTLLLAVVALKRM